MKKQKWSEQEKVPRHIPFFITSVFPDRILGEWNGGGIPSLSVLLELKDVFKAKDIDIERYDVGGCPTCGPEYECNLEISL